MENGDNVQYRYLDGEWETAIFVDETWLLFNLLDSDGVFRAYYKDRIEIKLSND